MIYAAILIALTITAATTQSQQFEENGLRIKWPTVDRSHKGDRPWIQGYRFPDLPPAKRHERLLPVPASKYCTPKDGRQMFSDPIPGRCFS